MRNPLSRLGIRARGRKDQSLRLHLSIVFLGLAVAPLLLVGMAIGHRSFTVQREQVLALQSKLAESAAVRVESLILRLVADLETAIAVEDLLAIPPARRKEILLFLLSHQASFDELAVLDGRGRELERVSRQRIVLREDLGDRSVDAVFMVPFSRRVPYFSPLDFDPSTGEPLLSIGIPLIDPVERSPLGVISARARFRDVWNLISALPLAGRDQVYIVDDFSRVIAHRNPSVVLRQTRFDLPLQDGITRGLDGKPAFLAIVRFNLGGQGFHVVAERPVYDALQLAISTVAVFALVTIAMLFLSVVLGITTVRRIVEPVEALVSAAQAVADGDLRKKVDIQRRDEIGRLASAFNSMTDQLRRNREGMESYRTHLEDLIRDRTAQLITEKERAEAANRSKTAFLANMSHELRTPLNAVLGFSQLMYKEPSLTESQARNLDIIIRSGRHLLDLINNVLAISKIESGKASLEENVFDLHQLIREVVSLMSVTASEKALSLYARISPGIPRYLRSDAGKIRQILINLVGNALKYTFQGEVVVRAESVPYSGEADGAGPRIAVRFEVEDSGPGIPPEDRDRIFEPFVRLDHPVPKIGTDAAAGTGLGLPICRQFVIFLGGTIEVESSRSGGSLFRFTIPLRLAKSKQEDRPGVPDWSHSLEGGRIAPRLLVADDNPESRLLLRTLLESMGFQVEEASDGAQAVEAAAHGKPDLIWMDIRMPVLNGLEAARRIRATPSGSAIPIIAVTAHALEEERREILAAGCDGFIRKPYQEIEIVHTLERYLGIRLGTRSPVETEPKKAVPDVSWTDIRVSLGALPENLARELTTAAELLDKKACLRVVDEIQRMDRGLGIRLRTLVENRRFNELLASLEQSIQEHENEETGAG